MSQRVPKMDITRDMESCGRSLGGFVFEGTLRGCLWEHMPNLISASYDALNFALMSP
jgi:hypothetical protein